jgi:hypothetical protein
MPYIAEILEQLAVLKSYIGGKYLSCGNICFLFAN